MVTIKLSQEQADFLAKILQDEERDLSEEIRHTDTREYKDELKTKREMIQTLEALMHPITA